jgi:hypothetical protein
MRKTIVAVVFAIISPNHEAVFRADETEKGLKRTMRKRNWREEREQGLDLRTGKGMLEKDRKRDWCGVAR